MKEPAGAVLAHSGPERSPHARNDCAKDAVTISLVNSLTSVYASITIFSVMGFKATNDHRQCLDR